MRSVTVSCPGDPGTPNEDWVSATPDLVVVLDGVTARVESGCKHSVVWFVHQLGIALLSEAADKTQPLRQALAVAIERVVDLHPECDLAQPGTPSAAVALVRKRETTVELLVLADVTIVVESATSELEVLSDDRPDRAAADARAKANAFPAGHPGRQEALRAVKHDQLRQRNQAGGYYVAASEPAAADEAQVAIADLGQLRSITMLTDGAARIVELFGQLSWRELVSLASKIGPSAVIDLVREAEAADATATEWPRSKSSDDATIAYLSIDSTD